MKLVCEVAGLYAFPEEWKTVDEANPNLFHYIVRFIPGGGELNGGRVFPRELTDKEKRELEEQAAAKAAKKQPKKDSKGGV